MFYEEKLINGIWQWRGTPNGEWTPFSLEKLSAKYVELKAISFDHETHCHAAVEEIGKLRQQLAEQTSSEPVALEQDKTAEIFSIEDEAIDLLIDNLMKNIAFMNAENCTSLYMYEAVQVIKKLRKALQYEKQFAPMVVMEFNEEEKPVFSQGFRSHEMLGIVSAERCTWLLNRIIDLESSNQSVEVLLEALREANKWMHPRHVNNDAEYLAAKDKVKAALSSYKTTEG